MQTTKGIARLLALLATAWVVGRTAPAHAVTVTFNAGSGIAFSYTENGMTVVPEVSGFYVQLGDNDGNGSPDLMNHPACCSTPYHFTYNSGAVFSLSKFDFVLLGGGSHTFTSSSGGSVTPGASGLVTLPAAGWTGITSFRWSAPGSDPSQTAVMDNLKFCPGDCDDHNGCTDDSCDPDATGADANGCVHVANTAACDDGLFCNGADTCSGGSCSQHAGDPCAAGAECANLCNETTESCLAPSGTSCSDDANPCTFDRCDGAGSCVHPANNTGTCDDGIFCDGTESCMNGSCVHSGNPCVGGGECANTCNETAGNCFATSGTPCTSDGNVCTDDVCNGAGACSHPNNSAPCDDNNACTTNDRCSNGACGGSTVNCNDGNPCTVDGCSTTSGCTHDSAPLEGQACDDGNTCTSGDTCTNGVCVGSILPQNCDDGNPCTLDGCNPTGGCTHDAAARDGFVCDDTNPCTMQDVCHAGVCRGTLVEADSDGDGYCDRVETAAGCNPNDAAEIPIQAATYAGTGKGNGEAIMTWAAPTSSKPSTLSEPSCAQTGVCGPIGFCTAGRTGNPCAVASDCDQPANTCRLVVNYGNVPNLSVLYARLNGVDLPAGSFTPATRACSRKVDIAIDPARRFNKLRLKAQGTVGTPGVLRRDKDSFKYLNY